MVGEAGEAAGGVGDEHGLRRVAMVLRRPGGAIGERPRALVPGGDAVADLAVVDVVDRSEVGGGGGADAWRFAGHVAPSLAAAPRAHGASGRHEHT
ncbi:MAG: hypothetical protein FJ035_02340 [Chloroflexi bacterium]|nr:hypothetical protein [Chloroflexota bacterium]